MARRGSNWTWTEDNTPERLRVILRALDCSTATLATKIGTTPQSIRNWHAGRAVPVPMFQNKLEVIENRLRERGMI